MSDHPSDALVEEGEDDEGDEVEEDGGEDHGEPGVGGVGPQAGGCRDVVQGKWAIVRQEGADIWGERKSYYFSPL